MVWKVKHIADSLWKYLNQPLFNSQTPAIWHYRNFWYLYRVGHLEICFKRDILPQSRYTQ